MFYDENIGYVQLKIHGKYALFTDPITKLGGENHSYRIPTYESLKGALKSCYWKPTFEWNVDRVRIMNKIETQTRGIRRIKLHNYQNELSIYCYLMNVEYQVIAHITWNLNQPNMEKDRNMMKHLSVANRCIEKGGRQDIFLGTRECQGYIEPCVFGSGSGYYDNYPEIDFGVMFHGFSYPDQIGKNEFHKRLWKPKMVNGIIEFIPPEECITEFIRKMKPKIFENK